jgi:hypothetical protein
MLLISRRKRIFAIAVAVLNSIISTVDDMIDLVVLRSSLLVLVPQPLFDALMKKPWYPPFLQPLASRRHCMNISFLAHGIILLVSL